MSIGALIIDDEPLAVDALRRMCERSGQVRIVGTANDGAAGLQMLPKTTIPMRCSSCWRQAGRWTQKASTR